MRVLFKPTYTPNEIPRGKKNLRDKLESLDVHPISFSSDASKAQGFRFRKLMSKDLPARRSRPAVLIF
jgi:hypothetical protein